MVEHRFIVTAAYLSLNFKQNQYILNDIFPLYGKNVLHFQNIQLRFSVMERVGRRVHSVGHVMVGASAAGKELTHWQHMLMMPRKPVAMWHQLRRQVAKTEEQEREVKLFLGADEPQEESALTQMA